MQTPGWTFEQVEFSSPFPAHKDLSNQLVFHGKTEDILKKAEDLRTFHGSHSFSKTNALGQTFRGVWPYDAHHTHDALGIHELLCELIYDLIFELLKHKNIVDFSWFIDMEIDMQDSPKKSSKNEVLFSWKSSIEDPLNLLLFYTCYTLIPQEVVLRSWPMDEVVPPSSV